MLVIVAILLGAVIVNGHPLDQTICGDCCGVKGNDFTFSTSSASHVYNITDFCGDDEMVAEAYCDASTDGGGWLVIQRRQDGSVDFNKYWVDYEDGFGSLTGEFWYGLRAIHCLTSRGQWQLRIDYTTTSGIKGYLSYSTFRVGSAAEKYKLTISGFKGVSSDPFSAHSINGMAFTTRDQDNDRWGSNCAINEVGNAGGWWYNSCSRIKLNHVYKNTYMAYLNSKWTAFSFVDMKIRPTSCY